MTAAAWGAIAGLIGAGTGIVGLIVAILAKGDARTANNHADRSATAAEQSAMAAKASAAEARRANEIAEAANERAERAERRATLRHDVVWINRFEPGMDQWVLINDGISEAHNVVVALRGQVHHDAQLGTMHPRNVETIQLGADLAQHLRAMELASPTAGRVSGGINVTSRVMWEDEAGGQHDRDLTEIRIPLEWVNPEHG